MPTFYLNHEAAVELLIQQNGVFGAERQAYRIYEVITVESKLQWAVIERFDGIIMDDIAAGMNSYIQACSLVWSLDDEDTAPIGQLQRFTDAYVTVQSNLRAKYPHDVINPMLQHLSEAHDIQWWAQWVGTEGDLKRLELQEYIDSALKEV
jgi:hypothetical protein